MSPDKGHRDAVAAFRVAVDKSHQGHYVLRLYVTGSTPKSLLAVERIKSLCEQHLKGRYDLEVVDLYQHPEQAAAAQVIAAPTLVKELPLPLRRLIGDLSDPNRVLAALDLKPGSR